MARLAIMMAIRQLGENNYPRCKLGYVSVRQDVENSQNFVKTIKQNAQSIFAIEYSHLQPVFMACRMNGLHFYTPGSETHRRQQIKPNLECFNNYLMSEPFVPQHFRWPIYFAVCSTFYHQQISEPLI